MEAQLAGTGAEDVKRVVGSGAPTRTRRFIQYAIAAAVVVAIVVMIGRWMKRRAAASGPVYETSAAARADVRVTVTATGTLEAITTVEVGAEVTGKLLQVLVDANDQVHKGQLLAVIDPELLRAA